jgi:heme/copper-type cytochrome/quinol oxidase subunit 1
MEAQRHLYAWLCLAVASLVGAGVFASLVAMARTPGIQDFLPGGDYFRVALVGHVILAVVVWFLAFQGGLWVLAVEKGTWLGFWLSALGTVVLMVSAILGWGQPVLANYVPVLTHPWFLFGLFIFTIGVGISALYTLWAVLKMTRPLTVLTFGGAVTAGLVLLALLCLGLAAMSLPGELSSAVTVLGGFENLTWGGGHVLQFANTAAMALVWLLLARLTLGVPVLEDRWAKRLLMLYVGFALPAPFLYLMASPNGYFTLLMAIGLGPATWIIGMVLVLAMVRRRQAGLAWTDPRFAALVLSMGVFGLGGFISLGIRESNVIIPAHYHGVIGGVTLAFMGLSYHLLTQLGRTIWSLRLAKIQPYLYGSGQTLFVLGLLWAGIHGVSRKTFGTAQELDQLAQLIGMSLMGLGGLVAIGGGIAFIVNMVPSLLSRKIGEAEIDTHRQTRGYLLSEQGEREGEAPSGFAGGGCDASPYNRLPDSP